MLVHPGVSQDCSENSWRVRHVRKRPSIGAAQLCRETVAPVNLARVNHHPLTQAGIAARDQSNGLRHEEADFRQKMEYHASVPSVR